MDNYQQLWQAVQQVVPGAALEPAALALELEQFRGKLLRLYHNKGPDAALRAEVRTGRVHTPHFGEVPLDYDPDQILAAELSDKLRLDEVTCVELLAFAQEMWGLGGLEAAFGAYLIERLDGARALCRLLALQLFHQLEAPELADGDGGSMDVAAAGDGLSTRLAHLMEAQPLLGVVVRFNEGLLREVEGGRNSLISRLIDVLKDHALDSLGPSFAWALDQYGCQSARSWYIAQERGELCRALLYAVVLSPNALEPATLAELLQLLEALAAKVKAAGATATHALLQQASSVLLACVAALSLSNAAGGAPRPPAKLAQLLRAQELQAPLQRVAKAEDSFTAVVALAWALTKDALTSSNTGMAQPAHPGAAGAAALDAGSLAGPPASALLEAAGKAQALGMLGALLGSLAFQLEPEESHKHLVARMVYGLLTDMLEFDAASRRELTESLTKASKQHMATGASTAAAVTSGAFPPASPAPGGAAATGGGSLALVPAGGAATAPAGGQGAGGASGTLADDLSSLLEGLAAVFRVRPGLWFDGEVPEAYPHVSAFMSYVAVHAAMQLPDVRVSFLHVMTSLAAGPRGSRFILLQFSQNATKPELEHFTWRKLFHSIVVYCRRYEQLERDALAAAGGSVAPHHSIGGGGGLLAARDEALMPAGDAALLVAYLDLLTEIVARGAAAEVRASLQGLERDVAGVLGGLPLYEPLFQLSCHGVPSTVKAAVFRCLAALGRFKELAPRLLERLLLAAVVASPAGVMDGYAGLPRFDLLSQITEVEARQEEYSETLAVLQLVNALLATLGPTGLPAGAAAVGQYTQLVLQHVVGHLWQRGYRHPAQKWQLAAACFKHCQLVLLALATWPANFNTSAELLARPPPGLAVLLSLMAGRQLEKALLQHVLGPGQEELATTLEAGAEGPPRAAATLEGFKLLNLALEYDQAAAEQLNALSVRERVAPLQAQLLSPQRRLAGLLGYVLSPDTALQLEAVRLVSQLAARLPDIVGLLQPNYDDSAALLIRQGFAQSLELALLDPAAGESVSAGLAAARDSEAGAADGPTPASAAPSPSDLRAELLLDVMQGTLEAGGPPPTLAHLLLGFDTTAPPQDWPRLLLSPHLDFTATTVLLRALQATPLQSLKPGLYAKCLQLLYTVAAAPLTCEPVCRLLHPSDASGGQLLPGLSSLLLEPLPSGPQPGVPGVTGPGGLEAGVHEQVASLRQRAFLLRLYALVLLRCEQPAMLEPVLSALLAPAPPAGGVPGQPAGTGAGAPALLGLQRISGLALSEPSLKDTPAELLQLQQDMTVDDVSVAMLLTQPSAMEAAGVVTRDDYGQPVFDFPVLQRLLHERYEAYLAAAGGRGGPGEQLARDAVVAAFRHAQQVNAHALLAGAQLQAVAGWVQAVEIAFTKTYALINTSTAPGCGPELLHSCLLGVLSLVKELAARQAGELAERLAGCCRVLLSKLQELASSSLSLGLPGDPLSHVRLPVRCLALLRLLLDCLLGSSGHKGLRSEMLVCVLQYLHFCRGSKLGDCPPLVLSCLLQGAGPGTSAAQLDALQQQLEEVNARLLRPLAGELVSLLTGDVLQPPERGGTAQAVALHLLAALVSADQSSTVLADALHRANVPASLLAAVASQAPHILLQPANKSQAALLVLEAQLSLLLCLAAAGGPAASKASIKAVADANALPRLTDCKALDFTPEQPSSHQRLKKSGALRYRLVHLVTPVLRLVLSLLAGAPGSSGLVQQAAVFTSAHQDLIARLLQEAAAPATAAWAPGDEELEQAALAVSLLARLPGVLLTPSAASAAGGAVAGLAPGSLAGLRRDLWRLWLVLAGHDRREGSSASGIVAQLRAPATMDGPAASGGALRAQQERRRSLLLQLRCGLASCLRDTVTPAAAGGATGLPGARNGRSSLGGAAAGGGSELLVCVGHQAQTTVDAMGRPTLLLVRDTADQALSDTCGLVEDLEDLLAFLSTPDSLTPNAAVAQKLADWGPGLAGLGAGAGGADQPQPDGGAAPSLALVLAGDAAGGGGGSALVAAAAAAAGGFGGLDPAAARRLARQCAARGASGLLGLLAKQLHLIEQCLAIVLLHFVQCLPRPDTAAVTAAGASGGGDGMMLDAAAAGGGADDPLLPSPGPEAAARLGSASDLQFFATKMRDVCSATADAASRVRAVLGAPGGGGGEGGAPPDGGSGGAIGAEGLLESLDCAELLNRQIQAYLAGL